MTESTSMASVLKKIQKDYDLRIGSLSDVAEDVGVVSSGNMSIDSIIGIGGLPLGRSIELFGPPSSGKSTTALQAAAQLQAEIIASGREEYIGYFDYENSVDVEYSKSLGLDMNHSSFLFTQPDSFENGSNAAISLIETGLVRLLIFDSVAAMTPEVILNADVGKDTIAVQARLMATFLQKINPLLKKYNCSAIFLNQLKDVIPTGYSPAGPQKTTPGGKALKFYASLRLEYKQIKNITVMALDELTKQEVKRVEATNVLVRVVKNKVGPPFREATVRVRFGRGFDNFWSALQILTGRGNIKLATGYYYFDKLPELVHEDMDKSSTGRPFIRGEEVILAFADSHPEWRQAVIDCAVSVVSGKVTEKAISPKKEPLPVTDKVKALVEPKPVVAPSVSESSKPSDKVGLVGVDDLLFREEVTK